MIEVLKKSCLFKYTTVNKNILNSISEDSLWHANVISLNDPFEFFFKFSAKLPDSVNELEKLLEDCNYFTKEEREKSQKRAKALALLATHQEENLRNWVKRIPSDFKGGLSNLMQNFHVCSLTKAVDEPLMWSHYSNGMRGICIAYDINQLEGSNLVFEDVIYEQKTPEYDFFETYKMLNSTDRDELDLGKILLTKHKGWEYEQEYRSVRLNKEQDLGFLSQLKRSSIKAVIFGEKISKTDLNLLKLVCRQKDIPLLKASADTESYKVIINKFA